MADTFTFLRHLSYLIILYTCWNFSFAVYPAPASCLIFEVHLTLDTRLQSLPYLFPTARLYIDGRSPLARRAWFTGYPRVEIDGRSPPARRAWFTGCPRACSVRAVAGPGISTNLSNSISSHYFAYLLSISASMRDRTFTIYWHLCYLLIYYARSTSAICIYLVYV